MSGLKGCEVQSWPGQATGRANPLAWLLWLKLLFWRPQLIPASTLPKAELLAALQARPWTAIDFFIGEVHYPCPFVSARGCGVGALGRDGGCMDKDNCITTLWPVPPAGLGVWTSCSPLQCHFIGNKHLFRGQVDQKCFLVGELILEPSTSCLFGSGSAISVSFLFPQ